MTLPWASAAIELMRNWANAAQLTAYRRHKNGDAYGAQLARARAQVYRQAADIAERQTSEDAAKTMARKAMEYRTQDCFSLIGMTELGLSYIQARAWQLCARTLDPSITEVQPLWE